LKTDEEVPVKVEAAIALQMILNSQDEVAKKYVEPQVTIMITKFLPLGRSSKYFITSLISDTRDNFRVAQYHSPN
jgi:hypothetical protein